MKSARRFEPLKCRAVNWGLFVRSAAVRGVRKTASVQDSDLARVFGDEEQVHHRESLVRCERREGQLGSLEQHGVAPTLSTKVHGRDVVYVVHELAA